MTALAEATPVDQRNGSTTVLLALLMPVGPAAIALLRYLLPYYTEGTSTGIAAASAAAPARESAVLWLGYLGVLTLVPGVIALARLTRHNSPRLTAWGLGLAGAGYLSLGSLLSTDQVLWSAQAAKLAPATTVSLLDHAHLTSGISLGVFILGHVVGTVLLGLALMRSGRVPRWVGVVLAVSQPLHFFATVILGSNVVDALAWSLTALAMGYAARAVIGDDRSNPPTQLRTA